MSIREIAFDVGFNAAVGATVGHCTAGPIGAGTGALAGVFVTPLANRIYRITNGDNWPGAGRLEQLVGRMAMLGVAMEQMINVSGALLGHTFTVESALMMGMQVAAVHTTVLTIIPLVAVVTYEGILLLRDSV